MKRPSRRAAFTLLELMVALTIGGLTITSVYAIGSASTRVFRMQNDVSNAQTTLRMAMDQVKRDIARAGYLGTPRVDIGDQTCGQLPSGLNDPLPGSGRLAAISRFDNDVQLGASNSAVDPTGNNAANGFTVDEIVLFANYSTSDEYPILRSLGNADQVVMQHGFYEFQRDFSDWWTGNTATFNAGAFSDAFRAGRAVRIQLPSRKAYYDTIAAVVPPTGTTPAELRLTHAIPADCVGDLNGARISPLNAIGYHVRNVPADTLEGGRGSSGVSAAGPMAQLLRTEVSAITKDVTTPVTNGADPPAPIQRVVLDYVVAFNLEFTMSGANLGGGQPDDYVIGTTTTDDSLTSGSVNANPERVRAVTIELAARTPEQDSTFPFDPTLCNTVGLGCFQVFSTRPGAARVRSMRAEVFVPNVAAEGF